MSAAKTLNKHSREGDKGWSVSWGVWRDANITHRKNLRSYETLYKASSGRYSVNIHKNVKVKLHSGVWAAAGITPNILNLCTGCRSTLTSCLGSFFLRETFRGAWETVWASFFFEKEGKYHWPLSFNPVFLNRRAAARYRALASIILGRERSSWNW